ncbi:MAG TPA: ABC transporter ATP-binding protein [Pilimelia sp.]|nr:ABC transporter ATP-binding protein [Pilimelia sp.]
MICQPQEPPPDAAAPAAAAVDLVKEYASGPAPVRAVNGASVSFGAGRFTAIMGPSGSGKSTLLHCLAGLDQVTSGRVELGGTDLTGLADAALTRVRRDAVGFVFQGYNLLPTLSARENILLPLRLAGRQPDPAWFAHVTELLRLTDRLAHRPGQLSGGQQQRVACARALITRPTVIFADEPTGNLDSRAGAEVLSALRASVRELHQTVVMVTHDPAAAAYADRVVFLADGRIVAETAAPTADVILHTMAELDRAGAPC